MLPIQIIADPAEIEDFRLLYGDDRFERSLIDAGVGHIEAAFKRALGDRLLKFQVTSRGHIQWGRILSYPKDKTVKAVQNLGGFRITGIRPVIDVALDDVEEFEIRQDVKTCSFISKNWQHPLPMPPVVRVKRMTKWKRLTISFVSAALPVEIFPWGRDDTAKCQCPECAITPDFNSVIPTFVCSVCGDRTRCSCMNDAVHLLQTRENYDKSAITRIVETAKPRSRICHICRNIPITDFKPSDGDTFISPYYRYVDVAAITRNGSRREGENYIRERLGIPRIGEGWIGEALLLKRITRLFPNEEVIHQGSPAWLGRQRFDIWIPNLMVALEYNGPQHYEPIEHFGGVEGFERTKIRDENKRRLARENGVRLIEIPCYDLTDNDDILRSMVLGCSLDDR